MQHPNAEMVVTGIQNNKVLSGLLLNRLAPKNKAKSEIARIQNNGVKKLSSAPPTTAAKPVALVLPLPEKPSRLLVRAAPRSPLPMR